MTKRFASFPIDGFWTKIGDIGARGGTIMKTCPCCAKENEESAIECVVCKTKFPTTEAWTGGKWERVAVLLNEAEAERLDVELENRQIPHGIISYADSAWDGIVQFEHGWGQVQAPLEHESAIRDVLSDIREAANAESPTEPITPPPSVPPVPDNGPKKLCVSCQAAIPLNAALCPQCGYTQPEKVEKRK